jgi:hypothetical protein
MEIILEGLQELLAELEKLPVVPLIGSEEYKADRDAYRAKVEALDNVKNRATGTAILALPPEIRTVYRQIRDAYCERMFPKRGEI